MYPPEIAIRYAQIGFLYASIDLLNVDRLSENDFELIVLKKKLSKTPLEATISPSGRVWLPPKLVTFSILGQPVKV